MRYIVNQIWQHKDTKIYYRILHVFPELEIICWINILKVEDLPESISFEHIEQLYNDGLLNYISNEIVKLTLPENLTQQTKEKWEFHWGLIKDYVVDRELLYNKKKINYLINIKIPSEAGIPRTTVRRIFSRYWQRGMTKLAIVPDYSNSGGKGKNKAVSEAKRGRPGKYKDSKLNVDERLRKILVSGYNELYLKNPEASLKSAYEIFLALKFPNIKRSSRSKEIPSFTQFRYWGELAFPKSDRINKINWDFIG